MANDYAIGTAGRPIVVKYGGNALAADPSADPVLAEVAALHRAGVPVVVVHGGGPEIDRALAARGVVTRRIDGLRVTDAVTMETTEAVLCGTLNKRLVRACALLGLRAVGVSGEDGNTLVAKAAVSPHGDLGFVGEVTVCNPELLHALLAAGFLPVVAPVAVAADATHAFNINADLAAAAIAGALGAWAFLAITNVRRVLRDPDDTTTAIDRISLVDARVFLASEGCRDSMKPKMQAAIAAVEAGAQASYIFAAGPGSITAALERNEATIVAQ